MNLKEFVNSLKDDLASEKGMLVAAHEEVDRATEAIATLEAAIEVLSANLPKTKAIPLKKKKSA
jgi:hypothetical protein